MPGGFIDGQLPRVVPVTGMNRSTDHQRPSRSHAAANRPYTGGVVPLVLNRRLLDYALRNGEALAQRNRRKCSGGQ